MEEFEFDFPELDYDKIIALIEMNNYEVSSDYYEGGFDLNDGEGFAGIFDDHIHIHIGGEGEEEIEIDIEL